MLPKDILKYAVKVYDIEKAVMDELKRKPPVPPLRGTVQGGFGSLSLQQQLLAQEEAVRGGLEQQQRVLALAQQQLRRTIPF
jgi:hypothetical protein